MGIFDVDQPEDNHRQDQNQAQRQVRQEHIHVKVVLVGFPRAALEPTEKRDAREIGRVGSQGGDQPKNRIKQESQPWTNRPYVFDAGRRRLWDAFTAHSSEMLKGEPKQVATGGSVVRQGPHSTRVGRSAVFLWRNEGYPPY